MHLSLSGACNSPEMRLRAERCLTCSMLSMDPSSLMSWSSMCISWFSTSSSSGENGRALEERGTSIPSTALPPMEDPLLLVTCSRSRESTPSRSLSKSPSFRPPGEGRSVAKKEGPSEKRSNTITVLYITCGDQDRVPILRKFY